MATCVWTLELRAAARRIFPAHRTENRVFEVAGWWRDVAAKDVHGPRV
jgi:hypothetical protein